VARDLHVGHTLHHQGDTALAVGARDANFDEQRFQNIRADMIRELENSVAKRPSSQAMDDLNEAVLHSSWAEREKIAVLQRLDEQQLADFARRFWAGAWAEVLVYGNFERGIVDELGESVATVLPEGPAPQIEVPRVLKLAATDAVQYPVQIPHDDSVVAWYLQGDGTSWQDRAATALAGQVMKSGFFQQLRTEQQLGYVVSAFYWRKYQVPALVMLVQSPVADAPSVTAAMDTFINSVPDGLDAAQFERHKAALVSDILRPDKNMAERAGFYWRSIANRQFDFAGRQHLADAVQAFTLESWLAYFERVFLEQPHSLQVVAPGKWGLLPEGGKRYGSAVEIKASHGSYLGVQ